MEVAIHLYICAGCGIEKVVDVHSLARMVEKEPGVQATCHPFLCNDEGLREALRMSEGRPHRILIAACSPRVKMDTFGFDPSKIMVERVNLREHVAWSHEPKPAEGDRFDQNIQLLAEDQVRMGLAKLRTVDMTVASCAESSMRILVIGGGVAGMTAALEAGKAGYEVLLVEREAGLGGFASKLFKQFPNDGASLESSSARVKSLIEALQGESAIHVMTSARVQKITGAPGMFDVLIEHRGSTHSERVGAIVMAVGFEPYDATRLEGLGFGESPNIVTSVTIEKMATEARFLRPSDGQEVKSAAFVLCAGSREDNHLPYCSTTCCMTSLKQALYIREHNPDSEVYIFYRDMRTPGLYERFFWRMQEEKRVSMVRGEVAAVLPEDDGAITIDVEDSLLGQKIRVQVDLVILATGMVPRTAFGKVESIAVSEDGGSVVREAMTRSDILNLDYRLGPELPSLKYGFPDSHFICFPYETRRTGIYAAGAVRRPCDIPTSEEDGRGAALKAIQCVELTARGMSVHPRSGDRGSPELFMQRCTQCKRCTEECPFGMYDEDEKHNPLSNPTRCRRCGICMGSCPERVISFKDYSIPMVTAMIKAIHVPNEEEEKPRVIIMACENDAYAALDIVGVHRGTYNPFVRIIPLRCLGSLNLIWIADALSKGIDGVLLLGCPSGEDGQCHMVKGSELAEYRLGKIRETLERLSLEPERLRLEKIEISDYYRLPGIIDEFLETIKKVGPNPYKGF